MLQYQSRMSILPLLVFGMIVDLMQAECKMHFSNWVHLLTLPLFWLAAVLSTRLDNEPSPISELCPCNKLKAQFETFITDMYMRTKNCGFNSMSFKVAYYRESYQ